MTDSIKNASELYLVSPRQRREVQSKRVHARVEEIREQIRALALNLGVGSKLPTTRELCVTLNTSIATLTAALDLLETEQVLYRKERQGLFVTETINQKIIHIVYNVFTEHIRSPFWSLLWSQLAQQAEHRSRQHTEQYQFHFLHQPFGELLPENYCTLFNTTNVQGCLLVGVNAHTYDHQKLLHIPHVVYGGGGDITVLHDIEANMRLVMQMSQHFQAQRIGYWESYILQPLPFSIETHSYRHVFQRLLTEYHFPVHHELFLHGATLCQDDHLTVQEQGYQLALNMLQAPRETWPDVLYITDDMMTSGAFIAWEELGIKVGQDIKVISHANANSPILFGRKKYLSLVEMDPADIAQAMFTQLEREMHATEQGEERNIMVSGHLYLQA